MQKKVTVGPGQKVPDSGIYQQPNGGRATMVKGEPAPPTSAPNQKWKQFVDTNKAKR